VEEEEKRGERKRARMQRDCVRRAEIGLGCAEERHTDMQGELPRGGLFEVNPYSY